MPRIPRDLLFDLTLSLLRREARSLLADTARMVAALQPAPLVHGAEHIPRSGPVLVVANHYQRRDLWIGWAGSLIIQTIGRPVRWMVLGESRVGQLEVPGTRLAYRAVARTYGFVPTPARLDRPAGQAAAVRAVASILDSGGVAGFFPEGERGGAGGLAPPLAGAPRLAAFLSRRAALLPAAVWEEDGRLQAAFGPPCMLAKPDASELMAPIAALLPARLRG